MRADINGCPYFPYYTLLIFLLFELRALFKVSTIPTRNEKTDRITNFYLKIRKKPIRKAIEALIIIFVIFVALCGIGYIFLGVAEVPIQVQEVST